MTQTRKEALTDREAVDRALDIAHKNKERVRRARDEEFDTHFEVALNPYGTWQAIQSLTEERNAALDAKEGAETERDALKEKLRAINKKCAEVWNTDHKTVRAWVEVESSNALATIDQPKEGDRNDG